MASASSGLRKCSSVPGRLGYPLFSDCALSFYKDPKGFVKRMLEKYNGSEFLTRFLNHYTVFVTSNAAVRCIFDMKPSQLEMGYSQYFYDLYGDIVLFANGEHAMHMRGALKSVMCTPSATIKYEKQVSQIATKFFINISKNIEVSDIYQWMKTLCTELCLSLFLGLDFSSDSSDLIAHIIELTRLHWHGIISLPVNLKMPGMSSIKSSYGKALDAKADLLKIIFEIESQKLVTMRSNNESTFVNLLSTAPFSRDDLARNHILFFTCSLAPKALASLLTTSILLLGSQQHYSLISQMRASNSGILEDFLLEVQRLYPPFFGGRRVVARDCVLSSYDLSANQAVAFISHFAHRDEAVFPDPETFSPCRWRNENKTDKDKLFTFGAGHRRCIGENLSLYIWRTVLLELVNNFDWSTPDWPIEYKWLPVARPKQHVSLTLKRRTVSERVPVATAVNFNFEPNVP